MSPKFQANSAGDYASDMTAGMKKEFFDGSAIGVALGTNNAWDHNTEPGTINFIETEFGFPLFSSSRELERIIKRTFEENELYTKNLDYVDAVRENILNSLEQYYDLVPRIKMHDMLIEYREELINLLEDDSLIIANSDKEQISGEITNLNSKITGWEITSLQLNMQRYMNVELIRLDQLMKIEIGFNEPGYIGEYYIDEITDSVFSKALINDTEFKVLGIIKKNAEEKKRLAEKGKWDIYATTGGRYNFYEKEGSQRQDNFFIADADRRKLIKADILQLKDALTKKKEQMISTTASLQSWKRTYATKKEVFLLNEGSVDNYIQAFRSLVCKTQS